MWRESGRSREKWRRRWKGKSVIIDRPHLAAFSFETSSRVLNISGSLKRGWFRLSTREKYFTPSPYTDVSNLSTLEAGAIGKTSRFIDPALHQSSPFSMMKLSLPPPSGCVPLHIFLSLPPPRIPPLLDSKRFSFDHQSEAASIVRNIFCKLNPPIKLTRGKRR